jgi:HEPN domain-containing protein
MTRARVEQVTPDPDGAGQLAAQARVHLRSAAVVGVDAESAYGLCYQATLKALIAALASTGHRVTGGTSGHVLIVRDAGRRLGLASDLVDRIDAMRRARHRVFYEAVDITELELEGALRDAALVLDAVDAALEDS